MAFEFLIFCWVNRLQSCGVGRSDGLVQKDHVDYFHFHFEDLVQVAPVVVGFSGKSIRHSTDCFGKISFIQEIQRQANQAQQLDPE